MEAQAWTPRPPPPSCYWDAPVLQQTKSRAWQLPALPGSWWRSLDLSVFLCSRAALRVHRKWLKVSCFLEPRIARRNSAQSEMNTERSQRVGAANMEPDQVGSEGGSTEKKRRRRPRGGKRGKARPGRR